MGWKYVQKPFKSVLQFFLGEARSSTSTTTIAVGKVNLNSLTFFGLVFIINPLSLHWISRFSADKLGFYVGGLGTKVTRGTVLETTEEMQRFSRALLPPFLTLSLYRSLSLLSGSFLWRASSWSTSSSEFAQTGEPAETNIWEKWRHVREGGRGRGVELGWGWEPQSAEASGLCLQVPCWKAQQLWWWLWRHGNRGLPLKSNQL